MSSHLIHAEQLTTGSKPAPGELVFVQGFVNTVDLETGADALSDRDGLRRWLERHGLIQPGAAVTEEDHRRAVDFREAVRSLLLANNGLPVDQGAQATLQALADATPLNLRYHDRGARLEPAVDGVLGALGRLQAVMFEAMVEGSWRRLKACQNDACHWAFFDASRNRSGTWCTMEACGNRTKVRTHRRRKAQLERG